MDSLSCYYGIHGLSGLDEDNLIYKVALPRFLCLFKRMGVKATFFVVASDLDAPFTRSVLEQAISEGHEVANHTNTHPYNLPRLSPEKIRQEIELGHQRLERELGIQVRGFRAPGYNISQVILETLVEFSYRYDSSVFPCPPYYAAKMAAMAMIALRGGESRSSLTDPRGLLSPYTPYRPRRNSFWRPGFGDQALPLWEVPMAVTRVLRMPFIGTFITLGGTPYLRATLPLVDRPENPLLNVELHGIDLLDGVFDRLSTPLRRAQPDLDISLGCKLAIFEELIDRISRVRKCITLDEAVSCF